MKNMTTANSKQQIPLEKYAEYKAVGEKTQDALRDVVRCGQTCGHACWFHGIGQRTEFVAHILMSAEEQGVDLV